MSNIKRVVIFMAIIVANHAFASNYEQGQPFENDKPFEGVWIDNGYVFLIKDLGGEAVLHGKDIHSAWSAKCTVKEFRMSCKGQGETEKRLGLGGSIFNFEGEFEFIDGKLHEKSRSFGDGFSEYQSTVLREIPLKVPED